MVQVYLFEKQNKTCFFLAGKTLALVTTSCQSKCCVCFQDV